MAANKILPARALSLSDEERALVIQKRKTVKRSPVLHSDVAAQFDQLQVVQLKYEDLPTRIQTDIGNPADEQRMYVTEFHAVFNGSVYYQSDATARGIVFADQWQHPKTMNKRHARLWLLLTAARVEKLHCLSEDDAIKEGYESSTEFIAKWDQKSFPEFRYATNPWVIVRDFKLITDQGWEGLKRYIADQQSLNAQPINDQK